MKNDLKTHTLSFQSFTLQMLLQISSALFNRFYFLPHILRMNLITSSCFMLHFFSRLKLKHGK